MGFYAWIGKKMPCWIIVASLTLTLLGCSEDLPNEVATDNPSVSDGNAHDSGKDENRIKDSTSPQNDSEDTGISPTAKSPPIKRNLADLIEDAERAVVRIDVVTLDGEISIGSGFVVDKDGTIVTNHHVIAGAVRAVATFEDKTKVEITGVIHTDTERDIALLKPSKKRDGLHFLPLASTHPRKGESVVAFGAPKGLSFSASEGIVSAIRKDADLEQTGIDIRGTWIQTTAPISTGNSGGPLINMRGEVVGANTWLFVKGQNLNFAISSTDIAKVVADAEGKEVLTLREFSSQSSTIPVGQVSKFSSPILTVTIPAKRESISDVEQETDRFLGVTTVTLVLKRETVLSESLFFIFHFNKEKPTPPQKIKFGAIVYSSEWRFLKYRTLRMIIDDKRVDWGSMEHYGKIISSRGLNSAGVFVVESLARNIPLDEFIKLVDAETVEGQINDFEFAINEESLEKIRAFAGLIPTGTTSDGRIKVDAYRPENDPFLVRMKAKEAKKIAERDKEIALQNAAVEETRRQVDKRRAEDEKARRVKAAASKLRFAKQFLKGGKSKTAKKYLKEITDEFAETPAAKEAAELLKDIE